MVVRYISSNRLVCGKEFNLPRETSEFDRMYVVSEDKEQVDFCYYNSGHRPGLMQHDIPRGARTVEFQKMGRPVYIGPNEMDVIQNEGPGGVPVYRDAKGKVIKVGNH